MPCASGGKASFNLFPAWFGTISPQFWHASPPHAIRLRVLYRAELKNIVVKNMKKPPRPFCPLTKMVLSAASLWSAALIGQAQPAITNIYPDGLRQFEASSTLSFTANSSVGVTNVSVQLTVTSLPGVSYLENLGTGNGLTITGPATSESVSAPLFSNTLYKAAIQVWDANGNSSSTNVSFDTITPSYTFEAEDWDYTAAGVSGQFIDNPQTNKYAGLASTSGVDYLNASPGSGNASYRPQGMETETCSDVPRQPYIGTTNLDYDVGFATTGGWANYTRHYPAGLYNVYARLADGNGNTADAAVMGVVAGTSQLLGSAPLSFSVKSTAWQTFAFYPLLDASGQLAQLTNDGTASTLQVYTQSGNYNANFYMLMPANTNPVGGSISFSGVYPDGAVQFQPTNVLAFTILSPVGVPTNTILVQLTGTSLIGQNTVQTYTTANGLTVSGSPGNLSVSVPLASNTIYTAFVQAVDLNGSPGTTNLTFDTIVPLYTFEAEDFDYNAGHFFDNPQTNAYSGVSGTPGIDFYVDDPTSGSHGYRDSAGGPETEPNGDIPRRPWAGTGLIDYDVGFNDSPNWEDYTRNYPNGIFNIFLRAANGGGGSGSASVGLVTSGYQSSNQTVSTLGTFAVPATGNWQSYRTIPLKDSSGNLVKLYLTNSGPTTLRLFNLGSENANYLLLEPYDTTLPIVNGLYPNGAYMFQRTNKLAFGINSSAGMATNGITITLNGTQVSGVTYSGSSTNWSVSYPGLQPDTAYSATIAARTLTGLSFNLAFAFDTYSSNYYTWESGDYDYTTNGTTTFFDNPQFDSYNGLTATPGIDETEVTSGAPINEDVYRPPNGSTIVVCTQGGGDVPRLSFGTNATWRINWFGYGDFCNYTRHYPAGTYNVLARFTEGGAASSATLYQVTSGVGTVSQTTALMGVFNIPLSGWNGWEYETLVDSNNNPVSVTFTGTNETLQLQGPLVDDGQTINVGFFMLVPVTVSGPTLTASLSGGQIVISFPTKSGVNYQVLHKINLTDASWTPLGSPIPGTGAIQSVQYPIAGTSQGFYRIEER
ncbi:conserved hypothetical protein [Verrucomicrobia bacterium]|nr:conserved hypothetical protein [Verrucomicrobiota bacterium]